MYEDKARQSSTKHRAAFNNARIPFLNNTTVLLLLMLCGLLYAGKNKISSLYNGSSSQKDIVKNSDAYTSSKSEHAQSNDTRENSNNTTLACVIVIGLGLIIFSQKGTLDILKREADAEQNIEEKGLNDFDMN